MKYLSLMSVIAVVFSVVNRYSQTLTNRDLLGKWKNAEDAAVSYHFIDSVNVKINSAKDGISKAIYHLKSEGQRTLLTFEVDIEGIKHQTEYYVKQFDGKNLRLENTDAYDPIVETKFKVIGLWLIKQK